MPNRINKGKSPPRHNQSKTVQNKANRKDLKKQSKSKDKTSTITSWQIDGETTEQRQTLFSWAPKSLQTVTAPMKRLLLLGMEKAMATHSSVLAWRIPGMAEPGGLLSMGSHRVRHD